MKAWRVGEGGREERRGLVMRKGGFGERTAKLYVDREKLELEDDREKLELEDDREKLELEGDRESLEGG